MTDTLSLLKLRRSVPPQFLTAPGPQGAQLDELLAIAARVPDHGKLAPWRFIVFTGAARELTEALVVNPYDVRQGATALAAALAMPRAEQRERMQAMRRVVAEFNVYRWAGRMMLEAADLRRRQRTAGRLSRLLPR